VLATLQRVFLISVSALSPSLFFLDKRKHVKVRLCVCLGTSVCAQVRADNVKLKGKLCQTAKREEELRACDLELCVPRLPVCVPERDSKQSETGRS